MSIQTVLKIIKGTVVRKEIKISFIIYWYHVSTRGVGVCLAFSIYLSVYLSIQKLTEGCK